MKTQVLSIQPINHTDSLSILMSIGEEQHSFTFSRSEQQIGQTQIFLINEDRNFAQVFQFNQHIAGEVMSLARQFYKDEKVAQLPKDVGEFGTEEEAVALQKPFKEENFPI